MRKLKEVLVLASILTSLALPAKTQPNNLNQALSFSVRNYLENPLSSTWGKIYGGKYSLERTHDNLRPKISFEKYQKESNIGSMNPKTNIYGISAGMDLLFPPKKITPYVGFEYSKYIHTYEFKTNDSKTNLSYNSFGASMKMGLEKNLTENSKLFIEAQTQIAQTPNKEIQLNNNTFSLGFRF